MAPMTTNRIQTFLMQEQLLPLLNIFVGEGNKDKVPLMLFWKKAQSTMTHIFSWKPMIQFHFAANRHVVFYAFHSILGLFSSCKVHALVNFILTGVDWTLLCWIYSPQLHLAWMCRVANGRQLCGYFSIAVWRQSLHIGLNWQMVSIFFGRTMNTVS